MLATKMMMAAASGVSLLPETEALIARFTTPPTTSRAIRINTLIGALISSGAWAKLDAFYVLAQYDSQAARQNWIQNDFNLTEVSSPTFTADRGYTGNGSSSYLSITNHTSVVLFTLNNAELGVWSRTSPTNGAAMMGNANRTRLYPLLSATNAATRVNSSTQITYAQPNTVGVGLFTGYVSESTTEYLTKNAAAASNGARASQLLEPPAFILAAASAFCDGQASAGFTGASLSGAERTALYTALNNYLVAVGAA